MDTVVLGAQLVLAAVFATAGVSKLLDMRRTRLGLEGFGVSRSVATVGGPLLVLAELAVAVALIPASSARWGAVGAAVLFLTFSAGIANAMARGRTPDCNCFGNLHSAPAGRATLVRNLGLAAVAGFVALQGPGTELGTWVEARSAAELAAVGTGAAALALAALSLRLWSQNRALWRALAEARAARQAEPPEPEGLPVGTPAPSFELSGMRGETVTLESLRAGDRPVVMVFFDPGCGPCTALVPHVARWQAALAERVAIAVISTGELEQNEAVWSGQAIEVLLDPESEVTDAYRVRAWPSGIAIGRDGRIASTPAGAGSQDTIEVLVRAMLEQAAAPGSPEASPPATAAPVEA